MPYKGYKIRYSENGSTYEERVDGLHIKTVRKQFKERRPQAKIELIRVLTNKYNHL
jgi:hypothetical protein